MRIEKIKELLKEEIENPREIKLSPMILKRLLLKKIENKKGQAKINLKKISKLYINPEKIFYNPVPETKKTTIWFLVDKSGSMDNNKIKIANDCIYNIVKVGTSIPKLELRIIYWGGTEVVSVPLKDILRRHFPEPFGNTYPLMALSEVEKEIHNHNSEIIFITDGIWAKVDVEEIKTKYLPKYDIKIILIDDKERNEEKNFFIKNLPVISITEVEQLPEALLKIL